MKNVDQNSIPIQNTSISKIISLIKS